MSSIYIFIYIKSSIYIFFHFWDSTSSLIKFSLKCTEHCRSFNFLPSQGSLAVVLEGWTVGFLSRTPVLSQGINWWVELCVFEQENQQTRLEFCLPGLELMTPGLGYMLCQEMYSLGCSKLVDHWIKMVIQWRTLRTIYRRTAITNFLLILTFFFGGGG